MKHEFFAWGRVCRSKTQKPDPAERDRGLRYLQTTDELGAQVALLQSPIPPDAKSFYQLKPKGANQKSESEHDTENCQVVKRLGAVANPRGCYRTPLRRTTPEPRVRKGRGESKRCEPAWSASPGQL